MEGILKLTSKQLSYLSKAITAERFGQEEVTNTTRNTLTAQEHDELNESINRLICVVKDQPLDRISEETRPTGEEEWENKLNEILVGIDMDELEDDEGWWETSKGAKFGKGKLQEVKNYFREQLSLAREEGRKKQAELDRKIYGMSVEEFSKNYKEVEPLQNGEREEQLKDKIDDIVDDCIEWEESWDGEEESAHKFLNKPSFKDQIFHLIKEELSQSKKESAIETVNRIVNRAYARNEGLSQENLNCCYRDSVLIEKEKLEGLTNQKKDI